MVVLGGDGWCGSGGGGVHGGGGEGGLHCGGGSCVAAPLIRDCRTSSPLTLLGYDSTVICFLKIVVLYVLHVRTLVIKKIFDDMKYYSYICRAKKNIVAMYVD